jgi:hypothetical protein
MFLLKKRYWAIFALSLTLMLVINAVPANWVIYTIQQSAPGFQVAEVSGSLWRGRAAYSQWVDKGRALPLGELQWDLKGLSLLILKPCLSFSTVTTGQSIKGEACYSVFSGAATLKDVDIILPISQIAPFFSVELDGTIDAYIKQVLWQSQQLGETDISLMWQQAAVYNGSQWIVLGDIQGNATDDDNGGLSSQWRSVDAADKIPAVALDLKAKLTQLSSQKPAMRITGTIKPGANSRALKPMLQFVGEPMANGAYRIDINE